MGREQADGALTDGASGAGRLARGLGWASLGLGAAQLAAPDAIRRLAGVDDSDTSRAVVPVVGAREVVHAAGLLSGRSPALWAWTRVLGDAMDLGALGVALGHRRGERRTRVVAVTAAVAGIAALDLAAAVWNTRRRPARPWLRLSAAVTVNQDTDMVYGYWKNFENLPNFMFHLESVTTTGDGRSHWVVKAPAGRTVRWDAEVVEDLPGERIAWRSAQRAVVPNRGSVRFRPAPGDRGTEVRVEIDYDLPGGRLGRTVAKLFGEEPEQQVRDDLRRFKQILEAGEVTRSEGTPEGPNVRRLFKQRPAQPLAAAGAR